MSLSIRPHGRYGVCLEDALAATTGSDDKYIDPVEANYDIDEDDDQEGTVLAEGLMTIDEFATGLESLLVALESAKTDPNFGAYNIPLYRNEATRLFKTMGLAIETISTEAFSDDAVLSTEGLGTVLSKAWAAFKEMLAKFWQWLSAKFGKGSASEKIVAKGEAAKAKAEQLAADPKIVERVRERQTITVNLVLTSTIGTMVPEHCKLTDISAAAKHSLKTIETEYNKLGRLFNELENSPETKASVNEVASRYKFESDFTRSNKRNVVFDVSVDPNGFYKETVGQYVETKEFNSFSERARGLEKRLRAISSDLFDQLVMTDKVAAIYMSKHIRDAYEGNPSGNDDKFEEHKLKSEYLTALRTVVTQAIHQLTKLINESERIARDLLNAAGDFYATLNTTR